MGGYYPGFVGGRLFAKNQLFIGARARFREPAWGGGH